MDLKFFRTLLCCEGENSTWNAIINADNNIAQESFLRVIYKIVLPTIVICGLIGNTVIFLVISTPVFRGIAYLYLRGITLAHVGVLVSWIPICMYHKTSA